MSKDDVNTEEGLKQMSEDDVNTEEKQSIEEIEPFLP